MHLRMVAEAENLAEWSWSSESKVGLLRPVSIIRKLCNSSPELEVFCYGGIGVCRCSLGDDQG
jgi:hypothetical protein